MSVDGVRSVGTPSPGEGDFSKPPMSQFIGRVKQEVDKQGVGTFERKLPALNKFLLQRDSLSIPEGAEDRAAFFEELSKVCSEGHKSKSLTAEDFQILAQALNIQPVKGESLTLRQIAEGVRACKAQSEIKRTESSKPESSRAFSIDVRGSFFDKIESAARAAFPLANKEIISSQFTKHHVHFDAAIGVVSMTPKDLESGVPNVFVLDASMSKYEVGDGLIEAISTPRSKEEASGLILLGRSSSGETTSSFLPLESKGSSSETPRAREFAAMFTKHDAYIDTNSSEFISLIPKGAQGESPKIIIADPSITADETLSAMLEDEGIEAWSGDMSDLAVIGRSPEGQVKLSFIHVEHKAVEAKPAEAPKEVKKEAYESVEGWEEVVGYAVDTERGTTYYWDKTKSHPETTWEAPSVGVVNQRLNILKRQRAASKEERVRTRSPVIQELKAAKTDNEKAQVLKKHFSKYPHLSSLAENLKEGANGKTRKLALKASRECHPDKTQHLPPEERIPLEEVFKWISILIK